VAVVNDVSALMDEVRQLLGEVKAERRALFRIVIKHGDLALLHAVADLLEQQRAQRDGAMH
jgi:hypothetical protein